MTLRNEVLLHVSELAWKNKLSDVVKMECSSEIPRLTQKLEKERIQSD
jgi:hypothetical protein